MSAPAPSAVYVPAICSQILRFWTDRAEKELPITSPWTCLSQGRRKVMPRITPSKISAKTDSLFSFIQHVIITIHFIIALVGYSYFMLSFRRPFYNCCFAHVVAHSPLTYLSEEIACEKCASGEQMDPKIWSACCNWIALSILIGDFRDPQLSLDQDLRESSVSYNIVFIVFSSGGLV